MKNDYVRIIVYEKSNNFLNYLFYNNIFYENLIKCKDYYILSITYDNYKKINRRYKCEVIRYYGKRFIINFIKLNRYMLISFIISMFVLYLLSHTIFNIKINSGDKNIVKIINKSLKDNNIEIYKRKKNFKEIENIKEKILKENEDFLEWIEIEEKGCNYIINVTPRVKRKKSISNGDYTDIVASKDGKILFITASSGTKLKDKGDYVKKGEVIISGNIMKGEKLAYQVKSKGHVYAETWYTVKIEVPFKYTEYVNTGKIINRYYLDIFGNEFTLIGKYKSNNTMNTKTLILDKPYLPFKLYKESMKKYEYKEFIINKKEAYNEAIKRSDIKIKNMLNNDEYIISKNVLKKEVFSSKIKVEVFYKVYENIGLTSKIKNIEEKE